VRVNKRILIINKGFALCNIQKSSFFIRDRLLYHAFTGQGWHILYSSGGYVELSRWYKSESGT
jgi:hypothetical protein